MSLEATPQMSDAQMDAVRAGVLRVVSTNFDGSLVVREPDGGLLELAQNGDLLPHLPPVRGERVTV